MVFNKLLTLKTEIDAGERVTCKRTKIKRQIN